MRAQAKYFNCSRTKCMPNTKLHLNRNHSWEANALQVICCQIQIHSLDLVIIYILAKL